MGCIWGVKLEQKTEMGLMLMVGRCSDVDGGVDGPVARVVRLILERWRGKVDYKMVT